MLSLTSGIPTSEENPLMQELFRPAAEAEAERTRKLDAWRTASIDNLDRAVLDPDSFFAEKPINLPAPAVEAMGGIPAVRQTLAVRAYLQLANDGNPIPGGDLGPELFREKLARERFDGRGAESDSAFFTEIQKEATGRRDERQLMTELAARAATSELVRGADPAGIDSQSFPLWREEAKGKPGYNPGNDFAYLDTWNSVRGEVKANLEPYLGPLSEVWQSMRTGGSDWFGAYEKVPADQRQQFLASLALLARTLPAEQQPGLWEKVVKTNSRAWSTAAIDIMDFTGSALDAAAANNIGTPGETPEQTIARQKGMEQDRLRRNFIDDIERIRSADYDPVKALGFGEKVATGIVSTVPYMASAAVPYAGGAMLYAQAERSLAREFRVSLMEGKDGLSMSDQQATETADLLAPYAAAPYAAIERIQVMGLMGKLPMLEKALAATVNKFSSKALRFAGRTVGAAAMETVQENLQQSLPALTQELAATLSKEIPGTVWTNGKDGFLDGYWENTAVTFAVMLPLSVVAGAGGIQADQRARIFADTPDVHLRALGFSPDSVARIRAAEAQGIFQATQVIEQETPNRDPLSDDAKDATQEIAETVVAQKEAALAATDNGIMPRAVRGTDGTWTLYDTATGQEIGTAPDWQRAAALATSHANFSADQDADRIATVFTAYQAAEVSGQWGTDTNRPTEINLDLGRQLTAKQAAAESESARQRVAAQERLMGGDGSVTNVVLGQSSTELAAGQLRTVNRILEGGSVLDVFHEEAHGFRRQAHARGILTPADDLAFLRAIDTVLQGRTTREGAPLQILPADFDTLTPADQETALDEGISKVMEAEIVRTRKGGGQRQLPARIVSNNLSALARLLGDKTLGKFRSFIAAIREYFGLAIDRAAHINRGLADGTLDPATYEGYLTKLLGVDEQIDYDQQARDAEAAILDGAELSPAEGDPFSLGSRRLAVLTQDSIRRIQNPLRRAQAMERVSRKLEELRLEAERLELLSGTKRLKRSLAREAAIRQTLRQQELENEAWARHSAILTDDDLTKLRAQPGHALFADPSSPLRGRLLSKTAAAKKHPDLFSIHAPGEYDGSENVSRTLFGGTLTPDLAAQEAFEAGLIKQPYADDLWQLLESEARHVAAMKTVLEAAKADLREARTVAKAETNAWLATQVDTQATAYSPRAEILRSLAALDAILSSVPAEIRGKVGGWVQAARIADPDAGLQFLRERLAKVDLELEKWLKSQYNLEFLALLDRARPEKDEAGKRPRGKIGADVHALFADLREAMTLTAAETEAEATRLEILAEQEDLTPEQQAHAMLQANLVRLVGDWSKASAARREAAVLEATRVFESGYMEEKIRMSRQREDRGKKRNNLAAATGKAGTREERRQRAQKDEGTRTGRVLKAGLSLMSFEQVVQKAFGEGTPDAEALVDWERRAAHAKTDALQHKLDLLDDLFASLAGGKLKGEQLRFEMSDAKGITATDARGHTHTFSQLEAITATLMWRQEDGRRHMEGHVDDQGAPAGEWNYTQDFVDQLEDQLTDNAKAVRLHLAAQYGAEYDRLNSVFRQLYGVSLPRHAHYSPLTVKPAQAGAGQTLDPVTGSTMTGAGLTPGSLKTRSQTAIAEPDFRDALQTYIGHSKQMEHWIAYAPFATEAMALINARNVGNSVEAAAGKETIQTLRGWLDFFAQGGTRDASAHLAANTLIGRMVGRAAAVALVGRVSVLAIQSTQLAAALAEMPAAAYMVRLGKLFAGRLDWSAALRSDYIQRRKASMPPVVQQALEGLASSKPSRLKYLARKMGETISGADALFTAGTFAITYDYHLKQAQQIGVADPHAYATQAAERSTDRVAQPVRPGTRSLYEVTGTNPAVRIVWSFASDARQKLMLSAYGLGSKKSKGAKARAFAVTWLAGGLLASVIRAAMRDLRDDDDDEFFDEKNWDPKRLALSTVTGPFQGLPFLGDALEATAFKIGGEYLPEGNIFSNAPKAADRTADLIMGDRPEDLEEAAKDAETILSGVGLFSDSAAAASSFSHLIRDLINIAENLTGTD